MLRNLALFLTAVSFPSFLPAAIPNQSPDELESSADAIVVGTVESAAVSVSGNAAQSRWNVELEIKLESVKKSGEGEALTAGEPLTVSLWTTRTMSMPGSQGMNSVPAVGAQATFWLRKSEEGGWEPLYPNGIAIVEGHSRFDFSGYERHRKKTMAWRIGIPAVVLAVIGILFAVLVARKRGS